MPIADTAQSIFVPRVSMLMPRIEQVYLLRECILIAVKADSCPL